MQNALTFKFLLVEKVLLVESGALLSYTILILRFFDTTLIGNDPQLGLKSWVLRQNARFE